MMRKPLYEQPGLLPFALSRRRFLLVSAIAGAFSTAGSTGILRLAQAEASGGVPAAGFDAFVRLSQYLTGKPTLDSELAQAIYVALSGDDPGFADQLTRLEDFLKQRPTPPEMLQAALDRDQSALATVPKRVMAAWYLGVVGKGARTRALAYEQALMYPPVKDVIVMPSYARDVPGYWAEPPRFSPS